jgi:hypothetical protein
MEQGDLFLEAMDRKAKIFARSVRATVEANRELCSWVLNPLARWAEEAYGSDIFDAAAHGYAEYCVGVAKSKQIYERSGRYTPESMPEIVSGVYEHERLHGALHVGGHSHLSVLAVDDQPYRDVSRRFYQADCRRNANSFGTWPPVMVC